MMKKIISKLTVAVFAITLALIFGGSVEAFADETPSAVTIGATDYEMLTMKINKNGNSILYFSTDGKKTWNEVDGIADAGNPDCITMDISWASSTSNTDIYFKGNKNTTVIKVQLPKQISTFKVKFDKVNSNFEMSGYEDRDYFYWRKSTDYNWQRVPFDTGSAEYASFIEQIKTLRIKGSKLFFKLGQIAGTGINDMGARPSKEVSVAISKLNAAPSVKVNITKLTLNTKITMEYSLTTSSDVWLDCTKNMELEDIAPEVFYGSTKGQDVSIKFRVAATESKAASLETLLTVSAQEAAPTIGDSSAKVQVYTDKGKVVLKFKDASKTLPYEYCVIKPDQTFDLSKARWKSVTKAKEIKLSEKTAPSGSEIYVRYKGVNANAAKKIEMKLPSDYAVYEVK